MRPYEHYVPISNGLDDLPAAVAWARAHDAAAQRIAAAGRRFAARYLTADFAGVYVAALLEQYAALQRFTPNLAAGYVELVPGEELRAEVEAGTHGGCRHTFA